MLSNSKTSVRWAVLFTALTVINVLIFINRKAFQFMPYASYGFLYNSAEVYTNPEITYTASEINRAKQLSEAMVQHNMPALNKIESTGAFFLKSFGDQRGMPTPNLINSTLLAVFDSLTASKNTKAWCGYFGSFMHLFVSSQNIKGRYIEIFLDNDHHIINEFFVPQINKWVMTDIYNDILLAYDSRNNLLNAQEFRKKIQNQDTIFIETYKENKIQKQLLQENMKLVWYYHANPVKYLYYKTTNLGVAYSSIAKAKHYLLPSSWYHVYTDKEGSNAPFYFKVALLIIWLAAGIAWLASLLIKQA